MPDPTCVETTAEHDCGCHHWQHELFSGACPPPPPPNPCCGASPGSDVERLCAWGRCVEWFCVCGRFTGISAGPVGCPCVDNLAAWRRADPEQRPKRTSPMRRRRATARRRR